MKSRRDITLGEMQDECKKRNAHCGGMGICPYRDFCHETVGDKCGWGDKGPREWKLSDPPRFNEAQMAFWRGWYAMGARKAVCASGLGAVNLFDGKDAFALSGFTTSGFDSGLKNGEILDLAELLGKESE